MEYTFPSQEMILNAANGPSVLNPDSLQSVIEVYIIAYIKIFITSSNVMKVTSTITSFPSTQQWTNRKLAILKCVILIMIKYKDTPEDKEPTSVENMLSSHVSTYLGKDAFFVVLQKDDLIRVTVTGVVVVCDLTPAPTPVLKPNPTFPPTL